MKALNLIHSENHNGTINNGYWGANTLAFCVDLPKNAAVDYIRIKGEFTVDSIAQKNKLLNDIECPVFVTYHRELAYEVCNPDGMQRVAATAYFPEGIPGDLYEKVMSGVIDGFDVYYHLEAVTEAE